MTAVEIGGVAFLILFVLLAIRVPIGVAMMAVGFGGYAAIAGLNPALNTLKTIAYERYSSYTFSIVPLFLLMGEFATIGGISQALFKAANTWLGHRRGGIAMAAIGACAGFGAIAGSSLATAATMAQVALPEMRRYGYSGALATGTLAAGGTLGILIPPSIVLVIYAILAEQNIAKLFAAAFIPGILAAIGYMIAIAIYVRLYPDDAKVTERQSYAVRFRSLLDIWPVLVIFLLVIGGIYLGIFTPTEAAAVGAFGTGMLAFFRKKLNWQSFTLSIFNTAKATAMIFLIVLGAELINRFLVVTRLPRFLADSISSWQVTPIVIMIVILIIYLLLGCVMDSLSMILLTIPIFFPIVMGLDFGLTAEETAIWFGIMTLVVVEVGLITPPVGLNVFIINSMAKDVPMMESFRGVLPFLISDLIRIALLVAFPAITLAALWWFF
ncbi:MAG: TRAP transporter large permease [Deinococcales bacterium]